MGYGDPAEVMQSSELTSVLDYMDNKFGPSKWVLMFGLGGAAAGLSMSGAHCNNNPDIAVVAKFIQVCKWCQIVMF